MAAELASLSANEMRNQYLSLFVTQMQNQNPLEPLTNDQMTTQLAQFSQIEQLQQLNASFGQILAGQQLSDAAALIGKMVGFYDQESGEAVYEVVEGAIVSDGIVNLVAGSYMVPLDLVMSVEPPAESTEESTENLLF